MTCWKRVGQSFPHINTSNASWMHDCNTFLNIICTAILNCCTDHRCMHAQEIMLLSCSAILSPNEWSAGYEMIQQRLSSSYDNTQWFLTNLVCLLSDSDNSQQLRMTRDLPRNRSTLSPPSRSTSSAIMSKPTLR